MIIVNFWFCHLGYICASNIVCLVKTQFYQISQKLNSVLVISFLVISEMNCSLWIRVLYTTEKDPLLDVRWTTHWSECGIQRTKERTLTASASGSTLALTSLKMMVVLLILCLGSQTHFSPVFSRKSSSTHGL